MKKYYFFMLFSIILLSSCSSVYYGNMTSNTILDKGNFSYSGIRSGTASCFYVMGIGGMNHSALISEAKEKMLQENPLRRNEALVNQIVEWQNTYYFPFFVRITCIISAEVVKFDETDAERLKD